jgi:prepilin-type N-terminal cleavage/methylation domain-containing protein
VRPGADALFVPTPRPPRGIRQGQGGFTLIELLVAMTIAVALLGVIIAELGRASQDQQDIERRAQMQTDAQIGLERMTRELRQASWLYFRSSAVVDLNVRVRSGPAVQGVPRLVRYDCSTDTCRRYEGPPSVYPPPASPTFERTEDIIGADVADWGSRRGSVVRHDVFRPARIDPVTGAAVTDFSAPDFLTVRMTLEIEPLYPSGDVQRITIEDGVGLRNVTEFAR